MWTTPVNYLNTEVTTSTSSPSRAMGQESELEKLLKIADLFEVNDCVGTSQLMEYAPYNNGILPLREQELETNIQITHAKLSNAESQLSAIKAENETLKNKLSELKLSVDDKEAKLSKLKHDVEIVNREKWLMNEAMKSVYELKVAFNKFIELLGYASANMYYSSSVAAELYNVQEAFRKVSSVTCYTSSSGYSYSHHAPLVPNQIGPDKEHVTVPAQAYASSSSNNGYFPQLQITSYNRNSYPTSTQSQVELSATPATKSIELMSHAIDNSKDEFKCICGRRCKTMKILLRHIRLRLREEPFNCALCSKGFQLKKNLETHINGVHWSNLYTGHYNCKKCNDVFQNYEQLEAHVNSVHDNT